MALEQHRFFELASAVSDGDPIEWDAIESSAASHQDLSLIHQLQVLSALSSIHRQCAEEEGTPRHAIDLMSLATAISDRAPVAWGTAESRVGGDDDRAVIRQLRVLAALAAVHQAARQTPIENRPPKTAMPVPETDDGAATATAAPLGTWGELTLLARLGGGAFGDVYHAWDPKLARDVALKLLRGGQSERSEVADVVINEGRLLARVRHSNVVTVFGADRFDGRVGVWMDYIKGRTLDQVVRQQGPLGAREAILVGVDLCRALAAVHGAGLVHGDVKPQNVMREDGGRIVLMDFGAGRDLAGRMPDDPPDFTGTPIYMAPELFDGSPASVGSDIYSLGVLLFYLVTRSYPVSGRTMAEVHVAHKRGERRLMRDARPDLPAQFVQLVARATAPNPQERFETAGAMEDALANCLEAPAPREIRDSRSVWLAAGFTVAALIVVLVALTKWPWHRTGAADAAVVHSLAVLPMVNTGGPDQEYVGDGTTELLTANLSKIPSIKVISHTSTLRYKGTNRTPVEIAADLNVDAVLIGSIARSRDRVRLNAQLIQAGTGQLVWGDSYERQLTDYFVLQADLVRDLIRSIRGAISPQEERDLTEQQTRQPEAQEEYLKGAAAMQTFAESGFRAAVEHFKRATELDPQYARGYASLAAAYVWLGPGYKAIGREESYSLTRAAAARALELDERLSSAHDAMALVLFDFEWNWTEAAAHLKRALELAPSDANAHQQYGIYLAAMGDSAQSIQELRRARELDPFLTERRSALAMALYYARQYEGAIAELEAAIQTDPQLEVARFGLARVYESMQRPRESLAQLERIPQRNDSAKQAELARVYAILGEGDSARAIVKTLEDARRSGRLTVAPENLAYVYLALRERDRALTLLEEAFAERSPGMCWLKVDPRFDDLRADPRFTRLLARLGLNQ